MWLGALRSIYVISVEEGSKEMKEKRNQGGRWKEGVLQMYTYSILSKIG